jgi:hypothetical protein
VARLLTEIDQTLLGEKLTTRSILTLRRQNASFTFAT